MLRQARLRVHAAMQQFPRGAQVLCHTLRGYVSDHRKRNPAATFNGLIFYFGN